MFVPCLRSIGLLIVLLLGTTETVSAFLDWSSFVIFPRIRCTLRFALLGFDVLDYDRFDVFFRDDSVQSLVETGTFVGIEEIQEYNEAGSSAGPYFITDPTLGDGLIFRFQGYDRETKTCEFLTIGSTTLVSDPTTTSGQISFESAAISKIFYNLKENYVSKLYAFLDFGFWGDVLPSIYDSDNTRAFICQTMREACVDVLPEGAADNCDAKLATLSYVNTDEKGFLRYQKNSQQCRALHAGLASVNPEKHCPHISFDRFADPDGKVKCQPDSGQPDLFPEDLFTEEELAELKKFQLENGLGESGTVILSSG